MRLIRKYSWILLYALVMWAVIFYSMQGSLEPLGEPEPEKVTLTFRHIWTKEHEQPLYRIFLDVVNEFQQEHPHVKVNFEGLDQTIHREQKLKSEMVTGTPPDLFVLFGGAELEPYARSARLMDLTSLVEELDLHFHDLRLWTFDDRVYGLPFEGHAEPVYYNRRLFEELQLTPPKTIEELFHVTDVLREHGYIPFALGNEELWPGAIYAHYLMDRYAGPELIERIAYEGGASFYNEHYLKALTALQQLAEDGAFNRDASDLSTEEAIRLFTSGRAAMYVNGSWDITMFRDAEGTGGFEDQIGVMPFPSLRPGEPRSLTGGYTIGIALSSNLTEKQKEAAYDLLAAMYTEEVQARIVYEGQRLPSMVIPIDPSQTGPVFVQVHQLMEQGTETFIAYDNVLSPEVTKSFLSVVDRLINLQISPEEALRELDAASTAYWKLRENR